MDTRQTMELRLREKLAPTLLEIADESHKHVGHAGASAGGHFSCVIVAAAFRGRSALERHRAVYDALGDLLQRGVHALALETFDPEEWQKRGGTLP
jgi:BolA family transcriptional regulator, general stress-responsive regulator